MQSPWLKIGGMTDHLPLLILQSKHIALAYLLEELMKSSSKWIKRQDISFHSFKWQDGYGASTIGQSNVVALKRYIELQKSHHRRKSFEDEFRGLLKKYRVDFDERYIWR